MAPLSDRRWRSFVWVDGISLVLFVVIGVRSHHDDGVTAALVRNLVPLLTAWFGVAWGLGVYRRPPGLGPLVAAWIVAVPLGLLARSIWVGSPVGGRLLVFLWVGLAFTLLFLLVGRGLHRLVSRRVLPAGPET